MNLSELRTAVREQVDVDEEELSNARLDLYLRDAFNTVIGAEREWPFYEDSWTLEVPTASTSATLPATLAGAITVVDATTRHRLVQVDHATAEEVLGRRMGGVAGPPRYYSIWSNEMVFWPIPNSDRTFLIRGWRKPTDWVAGGATATPDCDERLHIPLIYFACSLVYAQQEDEVLEQTYLARFREGMERARADIMRPSNYRPRILNGGLRLGVDPSHVYLIPPAG